MQRMLYLDRYNLLQLLEPVDPPPNPLQLVPIHMPYLLPQLPIIVPPPIKHKRRGAPAMRRRAVEDAELQLHFRWQRFFPGHVVAPA